MSLGLLYNNTEYVFEDKQQGELAKEVIKNFDGCSNRELETIFENLDIDYYIEF